MTSVDIDATILGVENDVDFIRLERTKVQLAWKFAIAFTINFNRIIQTTEEMNLTD